MRVNHFTVADTAALQKLIENTEIAEDAVALVRNAGNGTNRRFTYQNNTSPNNSSNGQFQQNDGKT